LPRASWGEASRQLGALALLRLGGLFLALALADGYASDEGPSQHSPQYNYSDQPDNKGMSSHGYTSLFIAQRLNRIEAGGPVSRVEAEDYPDGCRNRNGQDDNVRRYYRVDGLTAQIQS